MQKTADGSSSSRLMCVLAVFLTVVVGAYGQQAANRTAVDTLAAGFKNPPPSARLRCYWWWLNGHVTRESILHDLTEMKAKGYGGVLLVDANGANAEGNDPVPAGPMFGSPEWIPLFQYAVSVAHQLGLEMTVTITSGWNLGAPFIQPKDAIKVLTWSRAPVSHGETRLPAPAMKNGFYERIAVLVYPLRHGSHLAGEDGDPRAPRKFLAQKSAAAETGGSLPNSNGIFFDEAGKSGDEDAEVSEVRDVTSLVDPQGVLHWSPPLGGEWEALAIGYTSSNARLSPGSGAWQGLSVDTLSPTALDLYWDKAFVPILNSVKPYLGNTVRYVTTDSWEMGGMNWTQGFREEFRKRRGYDPVPYLPVVAGRILDSREVSDRFLADLRRTVGDLINLHFDRMAERAAKFDLGVECESAGPHGEPIDALETFRHSAVPQTEFWAMSKVHRTTFADRYFVKEASSAAHIYGRPLVAAEGMTTMGNHWNESIGMNLKPSFDMGLTEGLNRLVWHQFTSSPPEMGLPGQAYFAGTYLNPEVTWWRDAGAFTAYLNRGQFLMQQGKPVADVLYYYGDEVPNFVRLKSDDPAGVLPGYDYDVVDTEALLERFRNDGSALRTPEGIHYRVLVLPYTRILPLSVLEFASKYLHAGGAVVGLKPLRPQGIVSAAEEKRYQQLAEELWHGCEQPRGRVAVGRGTLFCTEQAREALEQMHVAPDFASSSPGLDFVHRQAAGLDIYFVRNSQPESVTADLTFRVAGRLPEFFDSVNGEIHPDLLFTETAEGTRIPLALAPYESRFIVFRLPVPARHVTSLTKDGSPVALSEDLAVTSRNGQLHLETRDSGEYLATLDGGTKQHVHVDSATIPSLDGNWTLSFPPQWGAPAEVGVPAFKSWTEFDESGIRYFSGTAVYHRTFHLNSNTLSHGQPVYLDLGDVRETAEVRMNGTLAATLWHRPYRVRVDSFLHAGDNSFDIAVTNLWVNRLVGDLQPDAAHHYTWTNIKALKADSPLLPSGILGPVHLVPFHDVVISPLQPR